MGSGLPCASTVAGQREQQQLLSRARFVLLIPRVMRLPAYPGARPGKHQKTLLFDKLLNKAEEIRCAHPTWDILVMGDFNAYLIYTPEPDEQLAAENAIWSVLPQLPPIRKRLDAMG
ncbi:hypothetical protein NDU88_002023 [Pleurodeles waltl]|uniref:Endonuclease/exonuclease/phosphatase domain-containing protein n=1 Tax=Pleurodeles waltl TaxID=8319 RepID=A0AAV7NCI8_PLEWA|nr:hypothetical protein NDU88_002023 [Pleurodeles waltl]